jgi:hypothetical protein
MLYLFNRLQEPSTYAGIAAFLASLGLFGLTETDWNLVLGAGAAVSAALSVLMKDTQERVDNGTPNITTDINTKPQ